MFRKIFAFLMAFFILATNITVTGEATIEDIGEGYYRYSNDFNDLKSKIVQDPNLAFHNANNLDFNNGVISSDGKNWGLFTTAQLLGDKPYKVSFDISATEVNPAPNCGAAFTVRGKKASTFMDQGVTFIVRDKSLRVYAKNQEISNLQIPFSFSKKMRRVWIEDDLTTIKFYANDDQDNKTLLAEVEVQEENLIIKDGNGDKNRSIKRTDMPNTGYFGYMSHFTNTSIDNFTYEFYKEKYEPVDMTDYWDTYFDTWVATDDLGREVPVTYKNTSKEDKKVGIFYFLWHQMSGPLYDHYAAYLEGGADKVWEIIKQGDRGYGHYWAEPYFGYYRSDDEWILRKHTNMLVDAGIDFIYFDMSNGQTYEATYMKLLKVWKQMREEGSITPQFICFFGDRTDLGYNTAMETWNNLYQHGLYNDLWFKWEGKPLMLGNLEIVPEEIKENFTIRRSWAFSDWDWYTETDGKGKWPWIALHPQGPGKNFKGVVEQVVVSCGFHSNSSLGRSFHKGKQPTDGKNAFEFELETTPYGLAFKEQWEHALKIDPPIVMITGWNEWWAGRWPNDGVGQKIANTYTIIKDDEQYMHNYVDCFNPEFSRDVEPMKGGFGDNYYYQMVNYIRQFKGTRQVPLATELKTIKINEDFDQWNGVGPEFRDTIYDTMHRDHPGNAMGLHYTNTTGRNDIVSAKVARDGTNAYFLVTTREDITPQEGANWMNLFLDVDQDYSTGWKGYDIVINRSRTDNTLSVEKCVDNSFKWEKVADAEYVVKGNKMHLSVPLFVLNLTKDSNFDFKWADNSTTKGDIMEFMDKGDVAPDDRFNFRFVSYVPDESFINKKVIIASSIAIAVIILVVILVQIGRRRIVKVR